MAVELPGGRPLVPSMGQLPGGTSPISNPSLTPQDGIRAVARKFADQPLLNPEPGVWAVLTAISNLARLRPQGMNMLLVEDEHCIGRLVEDHQFSIKVNSVSAHHCKIFREKGTSRNGNADSSIPMATFLKDISTNGTFHNGVKIRKSFKVKLTHGDIISLVSPPHDDNSYAFVYREVPISNGEGLKRKSEDFDIENKRLKGIGIGAPDGPISLDDLRRMQKSNMELRQELESHVLTVEALRDENRALSSRHEIPGLGAYWMLMHTNGQWEWTLPPGVSPSSIRWIVVVGARLHVTGGAVRGGKNVEGVINSPRLLWVHACMSLLVLLEVEKMLKVKVLLQELKEQKKAVSNSYHDQIKELHDIIDAKEKELEDINATSAELQDSMKDLNEKLDASRQSIADADVIINSQKVAISELQTQLDEERNKRREEREKAEIDFKAAIHRAHLEAQEEIKRQADVFSRQHREQQEFITKLLESEKETRLLVEMQRSKLEGARESLMTSEKKYRQLEAQFQDEVLTSANRKKKLDVMETELRKLRKELENEKVAREEAWAKVSSLELEIAASIRDLSTEKQRFQGARERIILRETQLRAFYSTTEEISSLFSKQQEQLKAMQKTLEDEENYENSLFFLENPKESSGASGASTPKSSMNKNDGADHMDNDDDDDCSTQKHDCQNGSQYGNTQDPEGGSPDVSAHGFGSDINGGTGMGTGTVPDYDPTDTERVLGTESQAGDDERNAGFLNCSNLAEETARMDDDDDTGDEGEPRVESSLVSRKEDNDCSTIRTVDLLASEAVGSWALDTAPSVYGENESPEDHGAGGALVLAAEGHEAGSQSNDTRGSAKLTKEQQALSAMISIVEPDYTKKFHAQLGRAMINSSPSDAETEDSNAADDVDSEGDSSEDEATNANDATNVDDAMIEDSVG